MLTSRIIPCLDVRGNRVVKGVQFQGLRDVGAPHELAEMYEQQGADEIVVLDVAATVKEQQTQLETVTSVREKLSIPLTVGGGIRSIDDMQRLTDAGADRISINTAAVGNPRFVSNAASRFGSQCVVVAIDAKSRGASWQVVTHSGSIETGIDVIDWAAQIEAQGAGEILLTSFDRDGQRNGYDCDLLNACSSRVSIPVIASGGANNAVDLFAGINAGASAVLLASILHDGVTTVTKLKQQLESMGANIRK